MSIEGCTFLTSLKMDAKAQSKQQKREELLDGAKCGPQILKLHGDLQTLADQLDRKVESKLEGNENAYFQAYTSHMRKVQEKFRELKQKADEEATKTRRDAKIHSLEKQLEWFMAEAMRLDEQCQKHKKDLDKWKGKAEALEDDRQFLENQIKGAKRHNKALRGAVEKAQTSAYSALVAAEQAPAGDEAATPERSDQLALAPADLDTEDALEMPASGLSRELESKYQTCVGRLKEQLASERRQAAKMRAVGDRQFGEPSEMEDYFSRCVEQVKSEIQERKKAKADFHRQLSCSSNRRPTKGTPPALPVVEEVGIDDFTAVDRRRLVELLLGSELVRNLIYERLYPPPADEAMLP